MAQVLIRNMPDDVVEALRARAKRNHRSLEAELRAILEHEVRASPIRAAEQAPAYGAEYDVDLEVLAKAIRYPDPDAPPFAPYRPIPVEGNAVSDLLIEDRKRW